MVFTMSFLLKVSFVRVSNTFVTPGVLTDLKVIQRSGKSAKYLKRYRLHTYTTFHSMAIFLSNQAFSRLIIELGIRTAKNPDIHPDPSAVGS